MSSKEKNWLSNCTSWSQSVQLEAAKGEEGICHNIEDEASIMSWWINENLVMIDRLIDIKIHSFNWVRLPRSKKMTLTLTVVNEPLSIWKNEQRQPIDFISNFRTILLEPAVVRVKLNTIREICRFLTTYQLIWPSSLGTGSMSVWSLCSTETNEQSLGLLVRRCSCLAARKECRYVEH